GVEREPLEPRGKLAQLDDGRGAAGGNGGEGVGEGVRHAARLPGASCPRPVASARAIRRCGELLRAIEPSTGGRPEKLGGAPPQVSRSQAARDAGLSRDQKRTPLRGAAAHDRAEQWTAT